MKEVSRLMSIMEVGLCLACYWFCCSGFCPLAKVSSLNLSNACSHTAHINIQDIQDLMFISEIYGIREDKRCTR